MNSVVRNFVLFGLTSGGLYLGATVWNNQTPNPNAPETLVQAVVQTPIVNAKPCMVGGQLIDGLATLAINNYRYNNGLRVLTPNSAGLGGIAAQRLNDMITYDYAGLINSAGQDISTQLAANRVPFKAAGFLVFKGCLGSPSSLDVAIADWLADPTSASILNNPNWTEFDSAQTFVQTNTTTKGVATGYYLITVLFVQN
jgi:uncharacterized protein YkwD